MSQITNDPVASDELPHPSFIPSADTIKRTPVVAPGERTGFADAFTAAKGDSFTVLATQQAIRAGYEPDPAFELTTKMIQDRSKDENGTDLPAEFIPMYASATSIGQLDAMYAQNLNRMNRLRVLSEADGLTRFAAMTLAELTDPIGLAANLVSGGGALAVNLTRTARLARAAKAGFVGAGVFGGLEAYRASQNPSEGMADVLTAAASGGLFNVGIHLTSGASTLARASAAGAGMAAPVVAFGVVRDDQDAKDIAIGAGTAFLTGAFGGAMSKATRTALEPVLWRLGKDVEASELPPELVTQKGKQYYAEQFHAETVNQRTADALNAIAPDATQQQAAIDAVAVRSARTEIPPADPLPTQSVGAATKAEIDLASPYGDRYDIELKNWDFHGARKATDSMRQGLHIADMGSMVGKSEVSTIRRVGAMIFDDHIPKQDGSQFMAGGAFVETRQRAIMAPYMRVLLKGYAEMRESGFTGTPADLDRIAFLAVTNGVPSDTPAPIARIAQTTAKNLQDLLETMQRHGVRGALDVPTDKSYMPHLWIRAYLDRNIADKSVGMANVKKLLTEAIAAKNGDLELRHHEAMAESIIKNAGKPHKPQFVTADAFEGVIESMREAGVPKKIIDEVAGRLEKRMASNSDRGKLAQLQQTSDSGARTDIRDSLDKLPADTGNPSNLKHRIQLDESHAITLENGKTLSVTDLLETNPGAILNTYSKRALGNSVLAQVMKHSENPNAPIKPVVSLQDLIDRLKGEAELAGRADTEAGNIARIEVALKHIVGIPIEDIGNPSTQRWVRSMHVAKHLLAGKYLSGLASGIVNVAEPLSALPSLGVKAVFKSFPALGELRKAAIDGKLTNHELALAEFFSGAGADSIMQQIPHRPTGPNAKTFDRVLTWLEPKAKGFADFGQTLSGMRLGNEVGEKMLGAAQVRRWGQWADSKKGIPEWKTKTTTLSPEMVERVLDQIRKHGTNDVDPRTGVRSKDLNWFDWTDNEAASAFRDSIVLESRRMFLRGNKIELQKWMGSSLGSLLFQFRGFGFQATRAKLAYAFTTKDTLHAASMLMSSGLGAAGYILYTFGESATILDADERKKFLDRRLNPKTIVAAAISRASWSSMLPAVVDSVAGVAGFDPVFSPTRSTGIQGKGRLAPLTGTPIGDEIDQISNMVQEFIQPPASPSYSFSQQSLINIGRPIMPRVLQQIHFMDNIARATGLPKKSKVAE